MRTDFSALRRRFPVLARKTYLNSGSYCALADTVRDAINSYMDDRLLVGANWDVWVMKNEAVRAGMAQVLRAQPDEIAVTASASAGLNALASALTFSPPRNKVVVSDFEFPTNAQIWHAQEPRGAQVVHVARAADGYIPAENFARAIDERTQLVAITHVCFRNGAKLDIPGIVRLARAKGAKVLLDCYQSVGTLPIDVVEMPEDVAESGGARLVTRHRPAAVDIRRVESRLELALDLGAQGSALRRRRRRRRAQLRRHPRIAYGRLDRRGRRLSRRCSHG